MIDIQCPICQQDNTHPFILFGPSDIVQCLQCGLVYVNPRRSNNIITGFFEESYIFDQAMLKREFGTWRFGTLKREVKLVESEIKSGKILDVGCAGGEFLSLFSSDDWSRYGIDPSINAVAEAAHRGFKIFQGVLQTTLLDCPNEFFDAITILDTFYFSPTPLEDLRKVHRLLVKDGILVVELPGFLYRLFRNVGPISLVIYRKWCHLSSLSPHLYYYSDDSFQKLLQVCGFKVEKIALEQSPRHGSSFMMLANDMYFALSRFLYMITFGRLNIAAKVVYLCKKV